MPFVNIVLECSTLKHFFKIWCLYLLLPIFFIFSVNTSIAIEYDFKKLANDIITESLDKTNIAVVVKLKNSGISKDSASAIQDALITAIQRRGHSRVGAMLLLLDFKAKKFSTIAGMPAKIKRKFLV